MLSCSSSSDVGSSALSKTVNMDWALGSQFVVTGRRTWEWLWGLRCFCGEAVQFFDVIEASNWSYNGPNKTRYNIHNSWLKLAQLSHIPMSFPLSHKHTYRHTKWIHFIQVCLNEIGEMTTWWDYCNELESIFFHCKKHKLFSICCLFLLE